MYTRRLLLALLAIAGMLLLAGGAGPLGAQVPTSVIRAIAGESVDGQGIVVTWTVAPAGLASDYFIILRRAATDPPGSETQIAVVGRDSRGYTDYTAANGYIWCYQVASVSQSAQSFTSPAACNPFVTGLAGSRSPVLPPGCTQFYQSRPAGTDTIAIVARFDPPNAVTSLWRLDPTTGRFDSGYFANGAGPVDFTYLPATDEFEFVCLSASATYR